MRIIGFNGPPRSGKDTLAAAIHHIHDDDYRFKPYDPKNPNVDVQYASGRDWPWMRPIDIKSRACIMPIRKVAFAFLGQEYSTEEYERIKDVEQVAFNGETLRQFMIQLMERYIKPTYGKDFAVRSMMNEFGGTQIHNNERLLLVTDIGFQEEVEFLEQLVGYESFCLVHIVRDGTSFENDSRDWCKAEQSIAYPNLLNPFTGAETIMRRIHDRYGWEF